MKQLSGLDAAFLYLETPAMPMHVGALHLFELPAGLKGRFVTAVRQHVAERLPILPALRRRVWWMPLNIANPAWVDAEPDLRQHIVEIKLARGAGIAELEAEVARLHTVLLPRDRPLWKFHIFEGLAPGPQGERRAAMYSQLHHAAVDGQAAVALANALLDLHAEGRRIELKPSKRQKVFKLEMTEMLRGVIGNQAGKIAEIVRELPATVGTLKDAAVSALARSSLLGKGSGSGAGNLALAPRTALNVSVGEGRAFATVSLPMARVKALGHAHGATVNDVVLWLCASALRRYFGKRHTLPRKSLVAAVPISLRAQGDTTSDNQASMSLVNLGTNIADPARRLAHVRKATSEMKATMGPLKSVLPTDYPSLGVPWLIEAATALYGRARMADRIPQLANVTISNVPGPPVALYLAGARMLTNYPASIIVHGLALNVTVQSYHHSLDFGLMADSGAMPDVRELADGIHVAFDDLEALARPGEPDHPETATVGSLAARAQRSLVEGAKGAVQRVTKQVTQGVAQKVVAGAIDTAVSQVVRRAVPGGGAKPPRTTTRRRGA